MNQMCDGVIELSPESCLAIEGGAGDVDWEKVAQLTIKAFSLSYDISYAITQKILCARMS